MHKFVIIIDIFILILCLLFAVYYEILLPDSAKLIIRDWDNKGIIVEQQVIDNYPEYTGNIRNGLGEYLAKALVSPGIWAFRMLFVATIVNFWTLIAKRRSMNCALNQDQKRVQKRVFNR